jgi:pilus assembly protein CpaF
VSAPMLSEPAAEQAIEASVARRLRREVAERLTRLTRAHETRTGTPMPAYEHASTTRRLITEALDAYAKAEMSAGRPPLHPAAESRLARTVADMLLGAGGLQPLLNDGQIEQIDANSCDEVFVRYSDGSRAQVAPIADTDADMVALIRRLAADAGRAETDGEGAEERRWDRASPILDLQLRDGSRLHAVMSVTRRPALSIRRHRYLKVTLLDLQQLGTINTVLRELLAAAVRARRNILVVGATGAGKTTMLRALASAIPPYERLVTIEDVFELALNEDTVAHPNVVAKQARQPNIEGKGAIDLSTLFQSGLRLGPDRVIVGEVRGLEVIPMLNAMSQGNDGSLGTLHASSSAETFEKIVAYAMQGTDQLRETTINRLVGQAVHLIVHLVRTDSGARFVSSVREVVGSDGQTVSSNEIFTPGLDERAVPAAPMSNRLMSKLISAGFDPGVFEYARHTPSGGWD